MIHNNPWVLTETIRYCPDCLAGDGSEIESLHGGAWRRSWRLPVVFACIRHRRLLHDRCPACGGLVHAANANSMIARMNDDALHPTQCRSTPDVLGSKTRSARPACGANLASSAEDHFGTLSPQTRQVVLSIQERLDLLLAENRPVQVSSVGCAVPVAQYFIRPPCEKRWKPHCKPMTPPSSGFSASTATSARPAPPSDRLPQLARASKWKTS